MVVYVNGKPIFVQNANLKQQMQENGKGGGEKSYNHISNTHLLPTRVKIPYMEIIQQSNMTQNLDHKSSSSSSSTSSTTSINVLESKRQKRSLDQDQEYLQLVSMFRQKNEKLYNPMSSS